MIQCPHDSVPLPAVIGLALVGSILCAARVLYRPGNPIDGNAWLSQRQCHSRCKAHEAALTHWALQSNAAHMSLGKGLIICLFPMNSKWPAQ